MADKKAKVDAKDKKPKNKPTGFAPVKFQEHTITQKRTGRFEVKNAKGKNVNGADKVKLLMAAKLMKGSFKKPAAEAAAT